MTFNDPMTFDDNVQAEFGGRRRRRLPIGVVAWVALWLVIGLSTAVQIWQLAQLSQTVVQAGEALESAGSALRVIGRIPLVGDGPEKLGEEVGRTAQEIQDRGASTQRNVRTLSVLLGLSIVVIPVASVLGWYVPARRARQRDRRSIHEALTDAGGRRAFEEFLAWRAMQNLPYQTLKRVTHDPWGDFEAGRYRLLANAELTRLGLASTTRAGQA